MAEFTSLLGASDAAFAAFQLAGIGAESPTKIVSDAGHGVTTTAIVAIITVSELGIGTENYDAPIELTDTGIGTESLIVGVGAWEFGSYRYRSDCCDEDGAIHVGIVYDPRIYAAITWNEYGFAHETISLSIDISSADTAHGATSAIVMADIAASSSGSSADDFDCGPFASSSGTSADDVSLEADIAFSENGIALDVFALDLPIDDAGVGSDLPYPLGEFSAVDAGAGSDGMAIGTFAFDTGSLSSEIAAAENGPTATDAGASIDLAIQLYDPAIEETPAGDDAPSVLAETIINETGDGADAADVEYDIQASDSGTASEICHTF